MILRTVLIMLAVYAVAGCTVEHEGNKSMIYPTILAPDDGPPPPPVIRQPVLPEMLVPCRGHVLVPALGMTFVPRNGSPPASGEFMREERVSPPYRIITPGARLSQDQNPVRLNIELDKLRRIVGLYCG
jgi:hypothetical protein